jgi:hypothetical protein
MWKYPRGMDARIPCMVENKGKSALQTGKIHVPWMTAEPSAVIAACQ